MEFSHDNINCIRGVAAAPLLLPPGMAYTDSFHFGIGGNNLLELFDVTRSANLDAILASVVACKQEVKAEKK